MPESIGLLNNHSNYRENDRNTLKNPISSHTYKSYQQCTEDCVSPNHGFSHKEKICLTTCYSNYSRATNMHLKSVFQEVL